MSVVTRRAGPSLVAVTATLLALLVGAASPGFAAATTPTTPATAPGAGPLPQVTPQTRAAELVQPATVFVEVTWHARVIVDLDGEDGDLAAPVTWRESCSGVVVNPNGYVVTAGHCADPGPDGAQQTAAELVTQKWVD